MLPLLALFVTPCSLINSSYAAEVGTNDETAGLLKGPGASGPTDGPVEVPVTKAEAKKDLLISPSAALGVFKTGKVRKEILLTENVDKTDPEAEAKEIWGVLILNDAEIKLITEGKIPELCDAVLDENANPIALSMVKKSLESMVVNTVVVKGLKAKRDLAEIKGGPGKTEETGKEIELPVKLQLDGKAAVMVCTDSQKEDFKSADDLLVKLDEYKKQLDKAKEELKNFEKELHSGGFVEENEKLEAEITSKQETLNRIKEELAVAETSNPDLAKLPDMKSELEKKQEESAALEKQVSALTAAAKKKAAGKATIDKSNAAKRAVSTMTEAISKIESASEATIKPIKERLDAATKELSDLGERKSKLLTPEKNAQLYNVSKAKDKVAELESTISNLIEGASQKDQK